MAPPSEPAWARHDAATDVLVLRIHAQPAAKRSGVAGIHGDRVKVRIAAPAVDGKANATLLKFVAGLFGVAPRDVELVSGDTHRDKTVHVHRPRLRPDRDWAQDFAPRS